MQNTGRLIGLGHCAAGPGPRWCLTLSLLLPGGRCTSSPLTCLTMASSATLMIAAFATTASPAAAAAACPSALTKMASFAYSAPGSPSPPVTLTVCEDLSTPNGSITFVPSSAASHASAAATWPLTLNKTTYANTVQNDDAYLNGLSKAQVINATTDIMGNALLGIHGAPPRSAETTLKEVWGAIPPIRGAVGGARLWTANRWSGVRTFGDFSSTLQYAFFISYLLL